MRLLVLKHVGNEGLGQWEPLVARRGIDVQTVEVHAGEPVPARADADGIVSLGGPLGAADAHPGLAVERDLLASAAEGGTPILGVCLGAQLLAHALGAPIFPNPAGREIGPAEVKLTGAGRADPLFAGLPDPLPVMQWHGDAFGLPAGADLLATAPACEHQAFRSGERGYGVLFHPEVGSEEAAGWLARPEYREYAEGAGLDPDEVLLRSRGLAAEPGLRLWTNWLDLV